MKYELTTNTKTVNGTAIYQIRATKDFGLVQAGDLGGWIEKESNLSQEGNAWVSDNAQVSGNAWVSGYAQVSGYAVVGQEIHLISGNTDFDASKNVLGTIRNSMNLMPVNGKLLFYKRVNQDLSSEYDDSFRYVVGEYAEVSNYERDESISCGAGIHGSHANYYPIRNGKVIIALECAIEDIICCQRGKIRVKKAKVLGICDV